MSLQVVDVKFQPAAASGIAKWIPFLHAKSISAKMWLCPGLDTFECSPRGCDLPSWWLSLKSCGVKVVFLNGLLDCVFIISGIFEFPHLAVRLCCSRLVPVSLSLTFTMRLCGSIVSSDAPASVPCHLISQDTSVVPLPFGSKLGEATLLNEREWGEWGQGTYLLGFLSVGSPRAGYIPPLKSSSPVKQLPLQNSLSP